MSKALSKEKQTQILKLLAENEPYSVIAEAVGCHIQTVKVYAAEYRDEIEEARKKFTEEILNRGLANKEFRVRKLARLATRIEKTLEEKEDGGMGIWVDDVKIAGNGNTVDVKVFAGEAVRQYRGLLDDIAKEIGGRVVKTDITTGGMPVKQFVSVSPDDWDNPETETEDGPDPE